MHRHAGIYVAAALAATILSGPASADLTGDHEPFAGRAVALEPFADYQRRAFYVPADDGVRLAMTVYLPTDGPDVDQFPVLLWYMPGHRESINPATGEIESAFAEEDIEFFTAHGYALAAAEMRGSGASFGVRELDRGPQIGKDGRALVDWIAKQEWSDGTVGMVGLSYQGFSQYATAAEQPAALKAIFPEIAGFDDYTSMFYPGGILVRSLSEFASESIKRDDQNFFEPDGRRPRLPSVPVIDEDNDGELADEIPLDKDGSGSFLDDGPPTYSDVSSRLHIYYLATKDHLENTNLTVESLEAAPHRDSKLAMSPYSYADIDPGIKPARIAESGIATYHRGGWFDYHARDSVMWHATLEGHSPTRLMMAPTAHGGFPSDNPDDLYFSGPYFKLFGDNSTTRSSLNREKLRFFDFYVRGIDNGFDDEPPVLLYVMGEGWRTESEWPLARQQDAVLYFGAQGGLSRAPAEPGIDRYRVDLDADSSTEGANRWNYRLAFAKSPMMVTEKNGRRQSYTTENLDEDLEVTGHPIVSVTVSADTPSADLFIYLEDVTPDGDVYMVTEGQLRGNYPAVRPMQTLVRYDEGPAVVPQLPWHRFAEQDYVAAPFADGRRVQYEIDLMPTSWVFKEGHRLRVSITGADRPSFELHPDFATEDAESPVLSIHTGAASSIRLPVIPRSPGRQPE